jgi:hypothetical protein
LGPCLRAIRKKLIGMKWMDDLVITTRDDLGGSDGGAPYTLLVNQTEYVNARCLRFRQSAHRATRPLTCQAAQPLAPQRVPC